MSRQTVQPPTWALAALFLGLSLALGAWAMWAQREVPEPGVTWGVPPRIPLAVDKSFGVNADLGRYDVAAREAALAAMERAGFRWLRQPFPWDVIEPERGVYEWGTWDDLVATAARHNISVIAVLNGSPRWARAQQDSANRLAPPAETRDFGQFAAAVATRYGAQIDHYQIWDEPNIAPHWGAREIDVVAYAHLLREGAIQVRAGDPGAVILLAALAPNVESGGANMSEVRFLDALYEQGAAQWFDVLAAQPYDLDDSPMAPPTPDSLNWRRVALLRQVMENRGDAETAIWAVSSGVGELGMQSLSEVVEQARVEWPWLGPLLWAAWSSTDAYGQYAVTAGNGQSEVLRAPFRTLMKDPEVAWPGVYSADHRSARYEGRWRVTPSGADIGQSGDRLIIPFWGTRLDLTVRRGNYRAFLYVTVDGQAANALPRDAEGQAYLVLYDPLLDVATVTLAHGLPAGRHVASIVAERGWGQWAVVGWTVSREGTSRVPWFALLLGAGGLVMLGIGIGAAWRNRDALLSSCQGVFVACRKLDGRVALFITSGAALLVFAAPGTVLSVVALGLLALLIMFRPETGPPLIALALPFYQPGKPLLGRVFSMVEILTLLTAVAWLMNAAVGSRSFGLCTAASAAGPMQRRLNRRSALTSLDWGVVALVTLGAASLLWAEHAREAAREYRTVILEGALFYGLLRVMYRQERASWLLADAWILGAVAVSLVGVGQWVLGRNLVPVGNVWRVRGFYGSPNNLALYLGRVLPVAVVIAAWGYGRQRKWAYGLAGLAMAAALFLSQSRGAWLLGVPASMLFVAALRGRRQLAVVVGALLLVALLVLLAVGPGRLTSLLEPSAGTAFFRVQLWRSSWAMIRDHPLLGVGLDNFLYEYRTHYVLPAAWEEFNLSHPHNMALDFWVRLGVPGLTVAAWLLAAFFRQGWSVYRRLPEGDGRLLALGLMGGMVNVVAHGLADHAFFLVDLGFVFMLLLAVVQVSRDRLDAPDLDGPSPRLRPGSGTSCGGGC